MKHYVAVHGSDYPTAGFGCFPQQWESTGDPSPVYPKWNKNFCINCGRD